MKNSIKKSLKNSNGITLIALVVTIVILIIIATITINLVINGNIIGRAGQAKNLQSRAQIIDNAKLEVLDEQARDNGKISEEALDTILAKYGTLSGEGADKKITTEEGYEIKVTEIFNGTAYTKPPTTPTDNFATLKTTLENSNQDNVQINEKGVISSLVWNYNTLNDDVNDDECEISGYWDDDDCEHNGYFGNYVNGELENGIPVFIKSNNTVYKVVGIGQFAFWYITALEKIEVPEGIKTIGIDAFCRCENLTDVTLPNSLTTVGYKAFRGCSKLSSITFQDEVTSIGECFWMCNALTSITINRPKDSISGAPWGAPNMTANDVTWAN